MLLIIAAVRLPFLLGEVLGLDAPYHARAALAVLDGGLWLVIQDDNRRTLRLIPFLTLQVAVLLAPVFHVTGNTQAALAMAYLYLLMCGVLLAWLLRDRLRSTLNTWA